MSLIIPISCHPFRIWIRASEKSRVISSLRDYSQSSPNVYSGMHLRASSHIPTRGQGWSDRAGSREAVRRSARGRRVGNPKYKPPPKALCGGSGYRRRPERAEGSTRRSGSLPNSRPCSHLSPRTCCREVRRKEPQGVSRSTPSVIQF